MNSFKDIKIGSLYWFTKRTSCYTDDDGFMINSRTPFVVLNLSKLKGARESWYKLKILTTAGLVCYINIWNDTLRIMEELVTNENL